MCYKTIYENQSFNTNNQKCKMEKEETNENQRFNTNNQKCQKKNKHKR